MNLTTRIVAFALAGSLLAAPALAWRGGGYGGFDNYYVDITYGVRPSISLKSTTNVTGEGTSSSPFIISV